MSRKHFTLLLGITLAVALLVLLIPGKTGRESEVQKTRLLPGLQEQVNDLDRLRLTAAGGEEIVVLTRGDGFWRVEQARGYRADWDQLRTLLYDLAQAEIQRFVDRKLQIRSELRQVQRDLSRDIEALGMRLKFINIVLVPLLIVAAALIYGHMRRRKRVRGSQ